MKKATSLTSMLKTIGLPNVLASRRNNSDSEIIEFGINSSNGDNGKAPQY